MTGPWSGRARGRGQMNLLSQISVFTPRIVGFFVTFFSFFYLFEILYHISDFLSILFHFSNQFRLKENIFNAALPKLAYVSRKTLWMNAFTLNKLFDVNLNLILDTTISINPFSGKPLMIFENNIPFIPVLHPHKTPLLKLTPGILSRSKK